MGGISLFELALIAVMALLVLGPDRTVRALYHLGRTLGRLKSLLHQYQKELGLDEMKKELVSNTKEISSAVRYSGEKDASDLTECAVRKDSSRMWTMPLSSSQKITHKELLEKRVCELERAMKKLQRQSKWRSHGHLKVR